MIGLKVVLTRLQSKMEFQILSPWSVALTEEQACHDDFNDIQQPKVNQVLFLFKWRQYHDLFWFSAKGRWLETKSCVLQFQNHNFKARLFLHINLKKLSFSAGEKYGLIFTIREISKRVLELEELLTGVFLASGWADTVH